MLSADIEEKNPLKQGLKLFPPRQIVSAVSDWREESIKTRIETEYRENCNHYPTGIEEKNPLKQGLKQKVFPYKDWNKFATQEERYGKADWREESIKTRIETLCNNTLLTP